MTAREAGPGSTHWAALVRGYSFTFDTDAGALDVLATPSGTSGFTDLRARARAVPLRDLEVLVVDIADLMRMKRASGRVKDRMHLEVLSAMRDAAPDADEPRKT